MPSKWRYSGDFRILGCGSMTRWVRVPSDINIGTRPGRRLSARTRILCTHPTMSRVLKRLENIRNTSDNTSSCEKDSEVEWENSASSEIKVICEELGTKSTIPREKLVMRSYIDQGDLQEPIFVTPHERLYLPNIPCHKRLNLTHGFYQIEFDPTRPKQSFFKTNQKIFAYRSPDLEVWMQHVTHNLHRSIRSRQGLQT